MKPTVILIGIVIFAIAAAILMPAHYVEEHETITQVLWNDHEAVVFSGVRRDGWSGTYAGLAVEMLRGFFGAIPRYDRNMQWVVVGHITPTGVRTHIQHATPFFHVQPFEGALFRVGDPSLKWDGDGFVPVTAAEQDRLQGRTRASTPDYSNVEGWSSKMNLLNNEQLRSETSLNLGGVQVLVIADRSADRIRKTVTVQFGDGKNVEIVKLNEAPRLVSANEYESLMKAQ